MPITYVELPEDVIGESRALNEQIEAMLATIPAVNTVVPEVTRRTRLEGSGPFGAIVTSERAVDFSIPGPGGEIPLRVVSPAEPAAVYLHIHGGGWTLGAADQQDVLLTTLSDATGIAVVSVGYRLAPEHPMPAAPDDCEAAACWLVENSLERFGTDRLLIGGESAGAHLAALTLLRMRDNHGAVAAFSGANLVFGAFDLSLTPSARSWGARNLILSTPIIEWFTDQFLPGLTPEQRRDPAISPLYAELHGLPPALFLVGDLDPLLDDSLFMSARWRAAGNEAQLLVYPESAHGFTAFPSRLAAHASAAQIAFLGRAIGNRVEGA
ncbi:MAG: alpha/beta hydrolase [Acidimicrobiales bacterium]|jgi:acetyl esterase/lipase